MRMFKNKRGEVTGEFPQFALRKGIHTIVSELMSLTAKVKRLKVTECGDRFVVEYGRWPNKSRIFDIYKEPASVKVEGVEAYNVNIVQHRQTESQIEQAVYRNP